MIRKVKTLKEYMSLFWYFIFLLFFFILAISIIDSVKLRLKMKNIEDQINKKVEEEIKWYEESLKNYEKELEKYRKLYYESKRKADYYKNIYKKLQFDKEKIKLPKTSEELRERFKRLGYEPIN